MISGAGGFRGEAAAGGAPAVAKGLCGKAWGRPKFVNFPAVSYTSPKCPHSGGRGYKAGEFPLQIPMLATLLQKQKPHDQHQEVSC